MTELFDCGRIIDNLSTWKEIYAKELLVSNTRRGNKRMEKYQRSPEEEEYLRHYDMAQYDRPSIAADIAVFSIMGKRNRSDKELVQDEDNYRKSPEKKLKILLIKRAAYPYRDQWALPGGFCQSKEEVYQAARRELYEETHVKDVYLRLAGIYSDMGRDPRGWIISNTFLALIDGEQCSLKADTDAWEARWFDVEFESRQKNKQIQGSTALIENEYKLTLKSTDLGATNLEQSLPDTETVTHSAKQSLHKEEEVSVSAVIQEKREFKNYHETVQYEVTQNNGFAFDHAKIITCTLLSLRQQTEFNGNIVFDFLPELFTMADLQKAFEIILDRKLLVANFRRKMAPLVKETDQILEGAGHRPAKLFRRNVEMFYR